MIAKHVQGWRSRVGYWLDLGNSADSGQFVLGQPLNDPRRAAGSVWPDKATSEGAAAMDPDGTRAHAPPATNGLAFPRPREAVDCKTLICRQADSGQLNDLAPYASE